MSSLVSAVCCGDDLPTEGQAELKRELIETLGRIENGSASDAVDQTIQWSMWV
jgi:hypothetical protein